MERSKIGIIGIGMVGETLRKYIEGYIGYYRGKNLFCFDTDPNKGYHDDVSQAEIIFVCVPTPLRLDGSCDIGIVESVVQQRAKTKPIIVIKSTVVPGTCEALAQKYGCPILFNPEFLTEANAQKDFFFPDRQIVGVTSGAEIYVDLIFSFLPTSIRGKKGNVIMTATEAEFVKYRSNLFGALKVTFANQIAVLARLYSRVLHEPMDEQKILDAVGLDRRIGSSWLQLDHHNYRGYGGYCFMKDTNAQIEEDLRRLAQLTKDQELYFLASAAIRAIKADRDFNRALLQSQGLTEDDVSVHDRELSQKIETIKRTRRFTKE